MELNMDFVPQLPRDSDQLKQTLAKNFGKSTPQLSRDGISWITMRRSD